MVGLQSRGSQVNPDLRHPSICVGSPRTDVPFGGLVTISVWARHAPVQELKALTDPSGGLDEVFSRGFRAVVSPRPCSLQSLHPESAQHKLNS